MFDFVLQIIIAFGVWGIYWSIHRGINEIIKGIEALDERLSHLEKK